jgi:hypothetical protein
MSGIVYVLVVLVLVAALLGCLAVVAAQGWTLVGVLALFWALAVLAVLISYATSMKRRQRPPMP